MIHVAVYRKKFTARGNSKCKGISQEGVQDIWGGRLGRRSGEKCRRGVDKVSMRQAR